jgi:hypothetical protein
LSGPISTSTGWLNGCGKIACSGKSSYILNFHDSQFFEAPFVVIPNNILGNSS